MSNYLINIYQTLRDHTKYFDITWLLPPMLCTANTRRYWSLPKYEYCRYREILGNTGNTSIADTGRFWKILVIPVETTKVE
jgi:hypothetical protein